MSIMMSNLRVIWACLKKDVRSALVERVFTVLGIFVPVNFLILMSLFVLGGSHAPTAVVMLDHGPRARQFYTAMSQAHSFSLHIASAREASQEINAGKIVAVVTIPANFDARINAQQPVQVGVQINNLDVDFTNDIRRAIPLSITTFYARAYPTLVTITPHEIDWYAHDTDYIPYLAVSIVVVSAMVGGILQGGVFSAKEWERETMKELLLSPASRWSILIGKMLAAAVINMLAMLLVLLVVVGIMGIWPVHWGEVIWVTLLIMLIFITTGILLGTLIKRWQPVVALAMGLSIPLFFLSGAFGPISFDTKPIEVLAQIFPVYYSIVLQQHAFHGFNLNTLGVGGNTLVLVLYAVGLLALTTFAVRRSSVAH